MNESTGQSTDSRRLNEIIAEYFAALEAGGAPDREAFLGRHPEFAGALREFFDDRQAFERWPKR